MQPTCYRHKSRILLIGPSHSGKSHYLGQLLQHEEALFGSPFESIVLFKTVPSQDYLRWVANNDRITIEDRTPSEVLEELVCQDKDQYPRCLYLFEDYLTNSKNTDKNLVTYWTAASNHCNLIVVATGEGKKLQTLLCQNASFCCIQLKSSSTPSLISERLPCSQLCWGCGLHFGTRAN